MAGLGRWVQEHPALLTLTRSTPKGASNATGPETRVTAAPAARGFGEAAQAAFDSLSVPTARSEPVVTAPAPQSASVEAISNYPLGAARAQVHANYIVAQTDDGLVIVDQHAAHERLVFEQMRKALTGRRLPSQGLLIPEIVD